MMNEKKHSHNMQLSGNKLFAMVTDVIDEIGPDSKL